MSEKAGIKARVKTIVEKARHGPYATAKAKGIRGSITFSLAPKVWKGEKPPSPGSWVILANIERMARGGRAHFRPPSKTSPYHNPQ